ncbi:fungal-specific transcription factor domain-containing protein [Ilyonectria sp. MPI-CAGE-AT-0026]|nr:fungal-specific transcription factor domain-containing protein [Ilyonectria sp. MPI-CAGE-AT-0026]
MNQSSPSPDFGHGHKYALGGCKTCRRRHLKCDQTQPLCGRCRISGLLCEGFSSDLRWIVSTGLDEKRLHPAGNSLGQYARRQLYTEQCRQSMCIALVANVPSTVTAALDKIDERSSSLEEQASASFAVGPFSVFNTDNESRCLGSAYDTDSSTLHHSNDTSTGAREDVASSCSGVHDKDELLAPDLEENIGSVRKSPPSLDDPLPGHMDFLQWEDLFTWEWDMDALGQNSTPEDPNFLRTDDHLMTSEWNSYINDTAGTCFSNSRNNTLSADASLEDILWPQVDLIADAPLLLRHFNDQVIDQMSSLPTYEKSPWKILNIPSAIITLSQLTILATERNNINHANQANFYALLAVSAFHLSLNSSMISDLTRPEGHWKGILSRAYDAAKHHLKLSLETETQGLRKAKYKDQLMAIHATIATSSLSGNVRDTRCYLMEMERLIRLRGLAKPVVSRRARLLHHIYAWIRIVSESTHVLCQENPSTGNPNRNYEPEHLSSTPGMGGWRTWRPQATNICVQASRIPNSHDITLDNFLRLEMRPSDYGSNVHGQKDPACSAQDIHLEDSRQDQDNMVMQIYGVPETWLSLVSQTTRLANVMDRLKSGISEDNFKALASIEARVSRLEDMICSFASRNCSNQQLVQGSFGGGGDKGGTMPHSHMLRALSSSLLIFFYRRIRHMNPWILQASVNNVIDSLYAYNRALEEYKLLGPGTAWPAFIAGAEAMTKKQREQIISWLDTAFSKSGFARYEVSKEILTETWRRRDVGTTLDPHGDEIRDIVDFSASCTWIDVCRDMQRWPLVC